MVNQEINKETIQARQKIIFVKVYVTEGDKLLHAIINYLHDEIKVKGVTVTRAITGFGKSGAMHSSQILTMSLDLPLIIEFFDEEKKIDLALQHLRQMLQPGHIVFWPGECV